MIIESTEQDIQNETKELFQKMKPYLDQGDSFTKSLRKVGKTTNTKSGWYKRIREYVINQGYSIGRKKDMKINHGRYYYKFLDLVKKMKQEDNSCFICGSTKNIKPHHINRVKESDRRYAEESNVVLLCGKHHHDFHKLYGSGRGVNGKNFTIFCKIEYLKQINRLKKDADYQKRMTKGIVNDAINRERTQLGSNVLRNLAENLGVEIE